MAYLFKFQEGAAKGVNPGVFCHMQELETQVLVTSDAKSSRKSLYKSDATGVAGTSKWSVKFKESQVINDIETEWTIPNNFGIVCAGLACIDMQL